MLRVGLTGGIASGKSAVAAMLRDRGCAILEADAAAHEFLKRGNPAAGQVVREFGSDILDQSGQIDRAKLGEIVFADRARLARLNALIHPQVLREIERRLKELAKPGGPRVAVVVAALLIETGYYKSFDRLAVAWCRPQQQMERLIQRGLTREQAEQRIALQLPINQKRRLADDEIDCSGALKGTQRQVEEVLKRWKKSAGAGTF